MNTKIVKSLAVTALVLLSVPGVFAAGAKEPKLVVAGPSDASRLVSIDWSGISRPEKYRWGLYRFDMEDKTYTFVDELDSLQANYLDDDLEPPVTKYFYKVERSTLNKDIVKSKPVRINKDEVARQFAASNSDGTGASFQGAGI
ncbi:MAG: hypothetical protein LBB47_07245, partial [Spirochaetaceae bacterium]|nr:hypothetical protein [Spirochaetaceae bacterium]